MENGKPIILIRADQGIIKNIKGFADYNFHPELIPTKNQNEFKQHLSKDMFDLIVYEIPNLSNNAAEKIKKFQNNLNHNINIPVIYLLPYNAYNKLSLNRLPPGRFDILPLPVNPFLLFNKTKMLLGFQNSQNVTVIKQEGKKIIPELNKSANELLIERTKQLSKEITDHLHTKLELNSKNKDTSFNHEYLFNFVDTIPWPILIKNIKGECITINKALEKLTGHKRQEITGNSKKSFLKDDLIDKLCKTDLNINTNLSITDNEIHYRKKDGKVVNLIIHQKRICLAPGNEPAILTLILDITQTRSIERLLQIQYTIDYISALNKGLRAALDNILEQVMSLQWVDAGGIYIYDPSGKKIELICHHGLSKEFVKQVKCYDESSPQFRMLVNKKNLYITTRELTSETKKYAEKNGILFLAIIPLFNPHSNQLIGSLNLASKNLSSITEHDKKGIESIAFRIVNLIVFAQAQEKLQETQALLKKKVKEKTKHLKDIIKELIQKEKEIKLSEEKYRKLQENLPVGMFSTNLQGQFLYLNQALVNMFLYNSVEEMMKISASDLFTIPEPRNELREKLIKAGYLSETEIQLVRKDNSVFWGIVRVNAFYDEQGSPIRFDGIIEDITEIKKITSDLEEANKKIREINRGLEEKIEEAIKKQEIQNSLLIQKSKLESLGELSAGIAHEINQPLGVIALTMENVKMKIDPSHVSHDYLEDKFDSIEKNIRRIREIIDHIRTFARDQESFVLDKINVNKVIARTLMLIGAQYKNHNINIKLELKENLGFTVGSNLKLEQVILNLLSNAKYALEEKGVYMSETDYKKEIIIRTESTSNKIILKIEDNGEGIKPDHLFRLFDPFFTTKPEGFGTGLGLSIVYGIIRDMRGEIVVNSKYKNYTKFKIFLPRFPEKD